ncbi:helix-turn-helix transcriptional regulator [Nocardiopsis sp. CA-288880]|uniref:helix-turn-helix transcriptional regulator n=1 Tax=Nocardiopsis sp. CA-288880 TaxID=3239995 RepID=UPI003D9533B5
MAEYEFVFVVDGITLDDHDAVHTLTEDLDAVVSSSHGVTRLTVAGAGPDAVTAARALMERVHATAPRVRLVRLDRELVGVPDIAELTGRTRQNVTQWTRGQRRDGVPFPAPEATVGRSSVWLWSEVNAWLGGIGLDDGELRPTRAEATEIDWLLQTTRKVELALVRHVDSPDVRRVSKLLAAHARTTREFIHYLVKNPRVRDPRGRYTILVCSPGDEAVDVFRRLESFDHPVVLATVTNRIHALVMVDGEGGAAKPTELVRGMTVRDWLGMIALSPESEFTVAAEGASTKTATISARSPMDLVGA